MSIATAVNLNSFDGDTLESYHRSAKRITRVLNTTNPIFLIHYHPTVRSSTAKLNTPLAQFNYNKNKRSAFFNFTDAGKMITELNHLLSGIKMFPEKDYTVTTSIGRIRFNCRQMWFLDNGERYNIPHDEVNSFYTNLIGSLVNFRETNPKGTDCPFHTTEVYTNGKREQTMFLVTHHGDHRHDVPMSFLRYVQNGDSGKLTLRYGRTELFWASNHISGMTWLEFIETLHASLEKLEDNLDKDHLHLLFTKHPILKKYNTYISTMQSFGKIWLTINTDMAPTNNKVMFMVDQTNFDHLRTFIGGVKYFLQDR
ncbi:hypothetical protein PQD71_gp226 [Kosakonia phage Kc263]|uniref:Uncharacterized protein n=1 Tax=Kosakonia phage Kc263 TaxID=2863194 RepID=A0AAE7WFV0_9CAUD|nr:hypothetical protein PQD71_gp226 [Kosakonia phage Kc263]QYN80100.1 hypothetical protein [Kosakonia phage Kc263]